MTSSVTLVAGHAGGGEEDQRRLCTRFFRTAEAQQRAIQGAGLGLSICKTLVESHRGALEVDSVPGEGTTFTVRLPAVERPPEPASSGLPGPVSAVS